MLPCRINPSTPIDEFPVEFTRYVRAWAYNRHYKGVPADKRPTKQDHELYAENIGVASHIIYNLMQYPTENIPAEVLRDLGAAISSEVRRVEATERVSCVVRCDYNA